MADLQMGSVESRFADIIWQNEPISSSELVKKSEEQFNWKKSTTFTVLKRLCNKGIFQNVKGTVTSLISKQDFYAMQSQQFVDETFNGSLPAFFAAFTARKNLSSEDIAQLKKMIDEYEEG
ncbi:MAG: BlaI/MecI/CopY family transcriptional regulator [Acutalibacteraceae bacterium]|nr:BlaI/MecI/CopY family transcriptional regulator [Acutalibacteraceae bacterium]